MHNMIYIIPAHNRSILNQPKTDYGCNCRDKTNFHFQNHRLTPNILQQEDVSILIIKREFSEKYLRNHSKRDIAKM